MSVCADRVSVDAAHERRVILEPVAVEFLGCDVVAPADAIDELDHGAAPGISAFE